MTPRVVALVCLLGAIVTSAAEAAPRSDEAEGKRRWKQGQELYAQKRYLEAAREFEAGYSVAPRPLFLLNIGHAYRRANELTRAKTAYQALLRLQPDLPQRGEVELYIKSIDDALQAGDTAVVEQPRPLPPAPAPAPASAPRASPQPIEVALPTLQPTLGTESAIPPYLDTRETVEPTGARQSESVFKKPWFWVIAGALVAGGVAAAVIASRPSTTCPGTVCIKE